MSSPGHRKGDVGECAALCVPPSVAMFFSPTDVLWAQLHIASIQIGAKALGGKSDFFQAN